MSKAAVSCGTTWGITEVPKGVRETEILYEDIMAKTLQKVIKR